MKKLSISITASLLAAGSYFLFKDTMNRIQYVRIRPTGWYLYWITRDTDYTQGARFAHGFMRTMQPIEDRPGYIPSTEGSFLQGSGYVLRWFRNYSTQVGIARVKANDLLEQMGGRELDIDIDTLRDAWL